MGLSSTTMFRLPATARVPVTVDSLAFVCKCKSSLRKNKVAKWWPGTSISSRQVATAVVAQEAPAPSTSAAPSEHAALRQSGICEDGYFVSEEDKMLFHTLGYVHLPCVLTEEEMQQEIDEVYERFIHGDIPVKGKDLCDMSGAKDRTPDEFTVYNVMLPRTYYPAWQGNLYERRTQDIANQLQGGDMVPDYDQILAKRPHSKDAIFAWHQDMAYWPPFVAQKDTATCWLAVSESTTQNGCMRFVPQSHREPELRPHAPVGSSRADSHALYTTLSPRDPVSYVPIRRGDITVHNEQVIHGSGPNLSAEWRKAYVLAFRKRECVAEERSYGFHHSHNDAFNWDSFHEHGKGLAPRSASVDDIANFITAIYRALSQHIHSGKTPGEYQQAADRLLIVEGALSKRQCRALLCICEAFGFPAELRLLADSDSDKE